MRDTDAALKWIVTILRKHAIPFHIAGGLAVRLYGSNRPLADIDIGVPDYAIDLIISDVKDYVVYGPGRYVDEEWNVKLLTLKYKNQEIDLAGEDSLRMFDKQTGVWVSASNDLAKCEDKEIFGLLVPVIPKDELIAYKRMIRREVDMADLEVLEG